MSELKDNECRCTLTMETAETGLALEAITLTVDTDSWHCEGNIAAHLSDKPGTLNLAAYVTLAMSNAINDYLEHPENYQQKADNA